jgi:hypothetical protein
MNISFRSLSILDFIGVAALGVAAVSLAGILWFTHIVPEHALFSTFHACLALGLCSFATGRVLEIARVIVETPDPRAMRSQRQVAAAAAAVAEHSNVTEGKFNKAA